MPINKENFMVLLFFLCKTERREMTMEWVTAKYNKEVIDRKVYLTTLELVEKQGKYNIFAPMMVSMW